LGFAPFVDDQITPWVAAQKKVNLVVWPTGYSPNRSLQTPAYVMAKMPTINCERSQNVPIFWSPAFVDNYQPFIAAVAARFAQRVLYRKAASFSQLVNAAARRGHNRVNVVW
jgi:hypothetical protein